MRALLLAVLLAAHTAPAATVPGDGDWPMPARDYASTRFSPLADLTPETVKRLQVAWTFDTGLDRGHEAAPLVVGGTMYVVTPYPNVLYAFDLTKPGANVKWRYEPKPEPAAQGVACCDVVNRGAAWRDDRVFFNTLDGQTVAVDARDGRELWRTKLGDVHRGETMTMAPLAVKDLVLVGNSGGELGVRGWLRRSTPRPARSAGRRGAPGPTPTC